MDRATMRRVPGLAPTITNGDENSQHQQQQAQPKGGERQPHFGGERIWEEATLGNPNAKGQKHRSPHNRSDRRPKSLLPLVARVVNIIFHHQCSPFDSLFHSTVTVPAASLTWTCNVGPSAFSLRITLRRLNRPDCSDNFKVGASILPAPTSTVSSVGLMSEV